MARSGEAKIVFLVITSWRGMSLGAEHYYGKLRSAYSSGGKSIDLQRPLSAADAAGFNQKDGITSYKAGNLTTRFVSRRQVIDLALASYRDHFPDAIILVRGRPANADPQPILDGPPEIMGRMNELAVRAEEIGYWGTGHDDEMQEICDEWDQIWANLR